MKFSKVKNFIIFFQKSVFLKIRVKEWVYHLYFQNSNFQNYKNSLTCKIQISKFWFPYLICTYFQNLIILIIFFFFFLKPVFQNEDNNKNKHIIRILTILAYKIHASKIWFLNLMCIFKSLTFHKFGSVFFSKF